MTLNNPSHQCCVHKNGTYCTSYIALFCCLLFFYLAVVYLVHTYRYSILLPSAACFERYSIFFIIAGAAARGPVDSAHISLTVVTSPLCMVKSTRSRCLDMNISNQQPLLRAKLCGLRFNDPLPPPTYSNPDVYPLPHQRASLLSARKTPSVWE